MRGLWNPVQIYSWFWYFLFWLVRCDSNTIYGNFIPNASSAFLINTFISLLYVFYFCFLYISARSLLWFKLNQPKCEIPQLRNWHNQTSSESVPRKPDLNRIGESVDTRIRLMSATSFSIIEKYSYRIFSIFTFSLDKMYCLMFTNVHN